METRGKQLGLLFNFKTLPAAEKSELCLRCHEEDQCAAGARYRYSRHAYCGVCCTDCHTSHYNVPPGTPATTEPGESALDANGNPITLTGYPYQDQPVLAGTSNNLGAVAPYVCYRCDGDMYEMQEIAGPHQILGINGFNCTTCHDPHGKVLEYSRIELCLECHKAGAPTMAFHSSTHYLAGVGCTDCHNPHPRTDVPGVVNINYTHVKRPKWLQMSVQEPVVCYKCHPKIFGLIALPSHRQIKQGKMVCSDCHEGHGQFEANLKGTTVNEVCHRCHADKQGPFVYEHPLVAENCAYCHQPHGTVANNLLRQPTTFLCLRCHSGHRGDHGGGTRTGIDTRPALQAGASHRWSSFLDTFMRYRMRSIDNPLLGLSGRQGDINTNQTQHEDLIEFGGTWTPAYNLLVSVTFGIEQRHLDSQYDNRNRQ